MGKKYRMSFPHYTRVFIPSVMYSECVWVGGMHKNHLKLIEMSLSHCSPHPPSCTPSWEKMYGGEVGQ